MEVIKKGIEDIEQMVLENSKKIDDNAKASAKNADKILKTMEKLHSHDERINKNSYALDILKDYKNGSKRLFIILIIVLIMWFATIGYLVYVLNDIGTIEEETSQEISDIQTIENSNIINKGDIDGENKTNN